MAALHFYEWKIYKQRKLKSIDDVTLESMEDVDMDGDGILPSPEDLAHLQVHAALSVIGIILALIWAHLALIRASDIT
tara:strand:+ start:2002 stop:2235 length:234 start_codon:yes stop_codon:yes gene_type:complete